MNETLARIVVAAAGAYLALGLVFGAGFVTRGVRRVDPAARVRATWGFRLTILPGVVALWPLLGWRWIRGSTAPPLERNAHRNAVVTDGAP